MKELHSAAERLRRERWLEQKTREIKELTVKGLAPEVQALVAKHKDEIQHLKALHEQELLSSDEKAGGRYMKMVCVLLCQFSTHSGYSFSHLLHHDALFH